MSKSSGLPIVGGILRAVGSAYREEARLDAARPSRDRTKTATRLADRCDMLRVQCAKAKRPRYTVFEMLGPLVPASGAARAAIEALRDFDALANFLQVQHLLRLRLVCFSALVFLLSFELFAHCPGVEGRWVVPFGGIVALLFGTLLVARVPIPGPAAQTVGRPSREIQMGYLSMRLVAELLRVAAVWRANGVERSVISLIPPRHEERLHFVSSLVEMALNEGPETGGNISLAREATREDWVADQLRFFYKTYHRMNASAEVWKRIARWSYIMGLGFLVGLVLLALRVPAILDGHETLVQTFLTLSPVGIVCAAIAEFYREQMGFDASAKRYEFGHTMFLPGKPEYPHSPMSDDAIHVEDSSPLARFWKGVGPCAIVGFMACLVGLLWERWEGSAAHMYILLAGALAFVVMAVYAERAWYCAITEVVKRRAKHLFDKSGNEGPDFGRKWAKTLHEQSALSDEDWRKLIEEIGSEAVLELLDWYVSSVDREIVVPKG